MDAHPTAKRCVVALDRWLPLIPFVCYPVLLCLLNVRLFRLLGSQRQAALDLTAVIARTVFVPGLTFWGGTILRDRLNLPRPYEQPGFEPLRHKETRGHSFPSRHALSASVLAMAPFFVFPVLWLTLPILVWLIEAEPAGAHSVPELARAAAMSPRHFTRTFTAEVGEPPAAYVERTVWPGPLGATMITSRSARGTTWL